MWKLRISVSVLISIVDFLHCTQKVSSASANPLYANFYFWPSCAQRKKYRLLRKLSFACESSHLEVPGILQVYFRPDLHGSYLLLISGGSHMSYNNRFPYLRCSRKCKGCLIFPGSTSQQPLCWSTDPRMWKNWLTLSASVSPETE